MYLIADYKPSGCLLGSGLAADVLPALTSACLRGPTLHCPFSLPKNPCCPACLSSCYTRAPRRTPVRDYSDLSYSDYPRNCLRCRCITQEQRTTLGSTHCCIGGEPYPKEWHMGLGSSSRTEMWGSCSVQRTSSATGVSEAKMNLGDFN